MNQITYQDFGLFRDELLQVDFISFNLSKLSESQILKLANYFQSLGFNCYQRKAEIVDQIPLDHFENNLILL